MHYLSLPIRNLLSQFPLPEQPVTNLLVGVDVTLSTKQTNKLYRFITAIMFEAICYDFNYT